MKLKRAGLLNGIILIAVLVLVLFGYNRWYQQPAATNEKTELSIIVSLSGDWGYQKQYQKMIEAYNRQQETVHLIPYFAESDSHVILKLLYSKQANQRYDIACLGSDQVMALLDMELIEPLDEYLLQDFGIAWMNERPPQQWANSLKAGNIYSLPFFGFYPVLYYNQELLDLSRDRISVAELLALAGQSGGQQHRPGLLLPVDAYLGDLLTVASQDQIGRSAEREHTLQLLAPEKSEMMERFAAAVSSGAVINYKENNGSQIDDFLNGHVPMLAASSYYQSQLDGLTGFPLGQATLMIDDQTEFPVKGGWLYLVRQSDSGSYPAGWQAIQALYQLGEQQGTICTANQYSGMAVKQNSKIRRMIEVALVRMWNEELPADEVLAQLQLQIDELLREEDE